MLKDNELSLERDWFLFNYPNNVKLQCFLFSIVTQLLHYVTIFPYLANKPYQYRYQVSDFTLSTGKSVTNNIPK